jgi:hypothetical protein
VNARICLSRYIVSGLDGFLGMATILVSFRRTFQVWLYTVSHGQLLLRSTKTSAQDTQVDVLFKNVAAISVPSLFEGLSISEVQNSEWRASGLPLGLFSIEDRTYFRLEGDKWVGHILAGQCIWCEGEADYFSKSPLLFETGL